MTHLSLPEVVVVGGSALHWTCHVCGEYRPDAVMGVLTTHWRSPVGIPVTQHVRYCKDRPACVNDAPAVRWLPGDFQQELLP